jgi:hypothetical protein
MIGYLTRWSNYNGQPVYSSVGPLLGMGSGTSGGWWGFLVQGGNFGGNGLNEIRRQVYSDDVPSYITKGGGPNGCSAASLAAGAVSGGMGGAGLGAMAGSPYTAVAGFIIGGLISGVTSAWQSGCF